MYGNSIWTNFNTWVNIICIKKEVKLHLSIKKMKNELFIKKILSKIAIYV
jgi:hypothetical protein